MSRDSIRSTGSETPIVGIATGSHLASDGFRLRIVSWAQKRFLPPTLFYLCIVAMVALAWLWPITVVIGSPIRLIGVVPLFVGLGISIWGSRKFDVVGTNIKTFDEPDVLVTDGLFRISRNPMYLGFALALSGVWIALGAVSPLLGVLVFVLVTDRWYIRFEERILDETFGEAFREYRSRTRRWI
jgi:protein-S-isoprenylcysteine O-methyltransferase Ste14